VPVFDLQDLYKTNRIEEFLDKNANKEVKTKILETIKSNEAWQKIISNPLMLKMLITIANDNQGKIPTNSGSIIREFMNKLYLREKNQRSGNFDEVKFQLLLSYTAYITFTLTDSNASVDKNLILSELGEYLKKYSFGDSTKDVLAPVDLWDFLKIACDMNILSETENQYSFTYEQYQLFFYNEHKLSGLL
jgi:hypothetical protein